MEKDALKADSLVKQNNSNLKDKIMGNKMKIKIGSDTFTAILYENKTAEALKAMMPLTLKMSELNGNEKYFQLSTNLPTNTENIGTIEEGDIMLWGANTLVLFYKTFQTSYRYTKIGRIENPIGLASAVGSGSTTAIFELE
ncbi:MAG: hypothetical protein IPJ74_27090 [Saprospiraceae bacterium]|nr:hypothetical protein [Saprospiraceae bacterium]